MRTQQGNFRPRHPEKYKGDPRNIVYRSSWELKLMMYLDNHPDVIQWQSEELAIPYVSPLDKRIHRYFVDFIVKIRLNGRVITRLIEVKPAYQTVPPTKGSKMTKTFIRDAQTYAVNEAKWTAAKKYCDNFGFEFQILTERELFGKK